MEIRWRTCILVIVFLLCLWNIKQQQRLIGKRDTLEDDYPLSTGFQINTSFPVDIVYLWVNGSDPSFQEDVERLKIELRRTKSFSTTKGYSVRDIHHIIVITWNKCNWTLAFTNYPLEGVNDLPRARNLAINRFADNEAFRFSLRSLEKYANWIRHVFIVTNGQIPKWLNLNNTRVTIVEHKEIIDESILPTFSPRVIGHNIHKIRGLSDKFIYMNDDFCFGKRVSLEDFYTENKGTKVRLVDEVPMNCSWQCNIKMIKNGICDDVCNYDHCAWDGGDCDDIPVEKRPKDNTKSHNDHKVSIFYTHAIYSRTFGYKPRRSIAHSPLLIDKMVKQDLDTRFENELNKTNHHRLRSPLDIHFEFSYVHLLMEAYNNPKRFEAQVHSSDVTFVMINMGIEASRKTLNKLRKTKRKFVCINDNIDHTDQPKARTIVAIVEEFYESMFPDPSSFEIQT